MIELTDDELKIVELDLLREFDEICKENDLKYSIGYGTFIGAIRHKGFIPWDDDIDVIMPREDYDKLLSLKINNNLYAIKNYKYTNDYFYIFSKFISKNNNLIEEHRYEKNMGAFIDVFPVDFFDKEDIDKKINSSIKYKKIMDFINSKPYYSKNRLLFFPKIIFKNCLHIFSKLIMKKYEKNIKSKNGMLFGQIAYGVYGKKDVFPKKMWDELVLYEFENLKVKGFKDYHLYLSTIYGDYMKLPPLEKQVTHHHFKVYKK